MTEEQSNQFDTFGCGSMSLICLANSFGAGFSKESFVDRYTPKYWANTDKCGGLKIDQVKEVAKDLGLARHIIETSDFDQVRNYIRGGKLKGILLATYRKEEPNNGLSDYFHCMLVDPRKVADDEQLVYLDTIDYLRGYAEGQNLPDAQIARLRPIFLLCLP